MRRVLWSDAAKADIRAQIAYIAADDPKAARHIAIALHDVGAALGEFAKGHPGRVAGTYEKSVSRFPYIIAYALTDRDRAVSILRVIHAARDWPADDWPD